MRLVLDENIPGHTEDWLRRHGHTLHRLPPRTADRDIAAFANRHQAIVLTRDRDFLHLLPSLQSGIVVIRIHPPVAPVITHAVHDLLTTNQESWLQGKILILHRDGYELVH